MRALYANDPTRRKGEDIQSYDKKPYKPNRFRMGCRRFKTQIASVLQIWVLLFKKNSFVNILVLEDKEILQLLIYKKKKKKKKKKKNLVKI